MRGVSQPISHWSAQKSSMISVLRTTTLTKAASIRSITLNTQTNRSSRCFEKFGLGGEHQCVVLLWRLMLRCIRFWVGAQSIERSTLFNLSGHAYIVAKQYRKRQDMGIRETLERVLLEYGPSKNDPFARHPVAAFLRGEARETIESAVGADFTVKGSAGLNDWAETPWIAILDPLVTDTTQKGFYVVYLFNLRDQTVFLSINQGVTAVKEEFGSGKAQRDILEAQAAVMRKRLKSGERLKADLIELSEATPLSKSYQWGHITGERYSLARLPEETVLVADLDKALDAYSQLIARNGAALENEGASETKTTVEERRRLRLHERIERVAADPKKIKGLKGFVCEACSFNFEQTYGDLGKEYIEAHHLVPISTLEVGKSRKIDMVKDFAVLCANCHRMAHRLPDPSDISALKAALRKTT